MCLLDDLKVLSVLHKANTSQNKPMFQNNLRKVFVLYKSGTLSKQLYDGEVVTIYFNLGLLPAKYTLSI